MKERTEGNLAEAVKLYQRIVAEFAGDRKLSARALMQMGLCYEKLGTAEAQKAYRRLISDYPEQAQEVAAARQRLATLATQAGAQKLQRIQVPTVLSRTGSGKLSPDGQKLALISGEAGGRRVGAGSGLVSGRQDDCVPGKQTGKRPPSDMYAKSAE